MIVQLLAVTIALANSAGSKVRDVGAGFGFREAEHELKIASAHLWKHLSLGFLGAVLDDQRTEDFRVAQRKRGLALASRG